MFQQPHRAVIRKHQLLTIICAILVVVGLTNLFSADERYGYAQLWHIGVAVIAYVACMYAVSFKFLKSFAYLFYFLLLVLQLSVLFFGHNAGGSQRWLELGILRFQPSEFAKLALIIAVARFFTQVPLRSNYDLTDVWLVLVMTLAMILPIFLQPDLGTAGIAFAIVCAQLFFVCISLRSILITSVSTALVAAGAWVLLLHDYQKLRVINLFNPQLDPYGSGYNSIQSIIAVGSGMFSGKGYLHGSQSQLHFLPAKHTDFVLSVFAEEHGFRGAVILMLIFSYLIYLGLSIAKESKDTFLQVLAVGLTAKIFVEFCINAAMILGLFPVVGTPLPFFSFGGSSLLANSIAMGLLTSIARRTA